MSHRVKIVSDRTLHPPLKRFIAPKNRGGGTIVEAAVIIPVLLVLMCAAIDYTRAYKAEAILSHAVYQGAMYGASNNFHPTTKNEWMDSIRACSNDCLENSNYFRDEDVQIQISTQDETTTSYVVTVTANYTFRTSIASHFFPADTAITAFRSVKRFR